MAEDFEVIARTEQGARIEMKWGEPDDEGVYEPTFTAIDDGIVAVSSIELAAVLPTVMNKQAENTYRHAIGSGSIDLWWQDIATRTLDRIRKARMLVNKP